MNGMTATTALLLGFALIGATIARGQDGGASQRTLSVGGTGRVSAAPDVADVSMGVVSEAATAREALTANNAAMAKLRETITGLGIADKDVQTTGINLSPRYSQPPQPRPGQLAPQQQDTTPRIVGYSVTNSVRVTARDLAKLGQILDAVVTAGANQMHGISFRVEASEAKLDEARAKAVADAKRKAEQLCELTGTTLGQPLQINESGGALPPPRPMAMMGRAMMAAESVPVAPGEQELSVSVQIVYAIE